MYDYYPINTLIKYLSCDIIYILRMCRPKIDLTILFYDKSEWEIIINNSFTRGVDPTHNLIT